MPAALGGLGNSHRLRGLGLVSSPGLFNVANYPGAGSPGAGVDNAIQAALADMQSYGRGRLYFPTGDWVYSVAPTLTPNGGSSTFPYAVVGDGPELTVLKPTTSSIANCLEANNPLFNGGAISKFGPAWGGFTIDGSSASGGAAGLIFGDISHISFEDIVIRNFTTGPGMLFPNKYGWTEGIRLNGIKLENNLHGIQFAVGVGVQLGVINSTMTAGTAYTTISLAAPLTKAITAGQVFLVYPGSGTVSMNVTCPAGASIGASSITISSFTPTVTLTAGTATVNVGSFGSFDYWDAQSVYMNIMANQHGVTSEVPLGISQNISRNESLMRMTFNAHKGVTNTGAFFNLKGNDDWQMGMFVGGETDSGSGTVSHKAALLGPGASIKSTGRLVLAFLDTPTYNDGTYQIQHDGAEAVKGASDIGAASPDGGTVKFASVYPRIGNIEGGVAPTAGTTSGTYPGTAAATTSGTAYQNTTGADVTVQVTITWTGTGVAAWNQDVWNGLPAGATALNGVSGTIDSFTFVHRAGKWARIDVTNATYAFTELKY